MVRQIAALVSGVALLLAGGLLSPASLAVVVGACLVYVAVYVIDDGVDS